MDQRELEKAALQRGNLGEMQGEIPIGHTKPEMPITREERDEIAEQQEIVLAGINPIKNGLN